MGSVRQVFARVGLPLLHNPTSFLFRPMQLLSAGVEPVVSQPGQDYSGNLRLLVWK